MFDKLKVFWDEHDMDRFLPWERKVCKHCRYPLSENKITVTTASGRKKKEYYCNLCWDLREQGQVM